MKPKPAPRPTFFPAPALFRAWLDQHHAAAPELWIGFHKKASGRIAMTYQEAVDEALCFGWIDGVLNRVDADSYMHRFTPRRPGSIWSNVNVGHVARLTAAGRMHAAGLAVFAARSTAKTGVYAFERKTEPRLPAAMAKRLRADKAAWAFFSAQPPWYRRLALHKIVSPKLPATRERWLARLIADSAAGRRIKSLG
jgi:uncharacterized protein YdeI (YjbR/CyaY-like superfamily)